MIKIIDLFAGVGGLSYGFAKDEKFKIIAANELLPNMAKAYELNHKGVKVYCGDIANFGMENLKADLGIKEGEIDLVIGGPPCQAYSTLGKRLIDDPRGQLFQQYYRVLKEINPSMFIFENVKGLISMQGGELFKTILQLFASLNYKVSYQIVNAADFGAPQVRKRIIIFGTKLDKEFIFPKPTHSSENYVTIEEAISDLPFIKSGEESFEYSSAPLSNFQKLMRTNAPLKLMDHNSSKNSAKLVQIMQALPDGGSPKDLPENLRPKSGFSNTYSRLWWNKPSTTLTRNFGTPSSSRCIHPKVARPITTREGARMQCFPDNYHFYGSRSEKNLQIGNAVPTVLSVALKEAILEYLS